MTENLALEVRTSDYDRFLCIQLAPAEKRADLYAVTAFHGELARVAETVSEPLLGHIRLAWWREALAEISSGAMPRQHPVVLALATLYKHVPQLWGLLETMIEVRAMDLDESLMAEEAEWQRYLDGTAGALHMAWAWILADEHAAAYEMAIRMQARGYAEIGLLRAIPYMHAQEFLRFPHARIEKSMLSSLQASESLFRFTQAMTEEAVGLISQTPTYPSALRPLHTLARLAQRHAQALRKQEFNPYRLKKSNLAAVLRVIQVKLFLC